MKYGRTMNWLGGIALGIAVVTATPRPAVAGDLEWTLMDLEAELDAMRLDLEDDFDTVVARTVINLKALDARGAPAAKLNKSAKNAKKALASLANATIPRLNRIEGNYIFRVLRENDGPDGTRSVSAECDEYIDLVTISLDEAKDAIDEALADELGD